MSAELDILAIEPFYGGPRKAMLDTIMRCSEHHWTLLKLPPRRIERRLTAAAQWFTEQIALHPVGNVDVIFASEALNLADFYRLMPEFAGKPSVVYFHDNQLPHPGTMEDITVPAAPSILANLSTAATATELWFNSAYHQRVFFERAKSMLQRHVKNFSKNPLDDMDRKCRVMPPPIDLGLAQHVQSASAIERDKRLLFVDLIDADVAMFNETFALLAERKEAFGLVTLGHEDAIAPEFPHEMISPGDELMIIQRMLHSGVFIGGFAEAVCDQRLITAISAGCWPIVPNTGVYAEIIGQPLDERCLYDCTPGGLAYTLQDFWELQLPDGYQEALTAIMQPYSATAACAAIDERLVEIAIAYSAP
jgi:hypothetical protein